LVNPGLPSWPGYVDLVVVRKWVRGNQASWDRQEIQVIEQPDGRALLRRIAQVHTADELYESVELAEQSALVLVDEQWVRKL
jgi:hypothetical protein